MKSEKERKYSEETKPMSIIEFNRMIDRAEKDSAENRFTNVNDLKLNIQTWT